MTDTNLPWTFFGRKLRPFAFALSLATGVLAYSTLRGVAVGVGLDGNAGRIVGAFAIMAVILLTAGFWVRSDRLMTNGLLTSTGVWASATAFLVLDIGGSATSALLAGCWTIAAAGSWLLEVSSKE